MEADENQTHISELARMHGAATTKWFVGKIVTRTRVI